MILSIRALRRSWWLILLAALLGGAAGGAYARFAPPVYEATTSLYVATQGSSLTDVTAGSSYAQQVVKSYANLVDTSSVLTPASRQAHITETYDKLTDDVTSTVPLNTSLVQITVHGATAPGTAALTQAISDSLIRVVSGLEPGPPAAKSSGKKGKSRTTTAVSGQVKLTQVQAVIVPTAPISPNKPLVVILGLLIGGILGAGGAMLRASADSKVRSEADVEATTTKPLLGAVAFDKKSSKRPLIMQADARNPRAESFRALRTNLQYLDWKKESPALVITSSLPGEGKSTMVANLAIALAESGQRVCVVDADLRRPKVGELFGHDGGVGLTDVLIGKVSLKDAVQPWGDRRIGVLPAGRTPPNPSELLGSAAMRHVVQQLRSVFDVVLIDSPPILPVTDAAVLAASASGVILACAVNQVKQGQLRAALSALRRGQADVLGIVLTKVPLRGPDGNAYKYGYGPTRAAGEVPYEAEEFEFDDAAVKL